MKEHIKKKILDILRKSLSILRQEDIAALDDLSNNTIQDASLFQNKEAIAIAVVIYSLAKIVHRSQSNPTYWKKVYKKIEREIESAINMLQKNKEARYKEDIKDILRKIGRVDNKLKLYIEDVLDKAKIVKGSKLYEQGISIERAAELLGISQWELMSYVGKTKIIDVYPERVIPIAERIKRAKDIFGLK